MAGLFLRRGDELREPRVQRPQARGRLTAADRGSEQRVGEAQALSVQLEDPCCERLGCAGPGPAPDGSLDELHGRVGKRGDGAGNLERCGAEIVEALLQEPAEVGGHRELLARGEHAAPALERSCQLEREEGVAARRLPDPEQGRPREGGVEADAKQLVDRADTEAADLDRPTPLLGHGAAKPLRLAAPDGDKGGERLVVQAGEGEAKRRERGAVQPLHVVDRHAEWAGGSEKPHRSQKRRRHDTFVGRQLRLAQEQSGLERPPLHRRQLGDDLAGRWAEQVGQPCE